MAVQAATSGQRLRWVTRADLGWGSTPARYAPCTNGLVAHYHGSTRLNLRNRDHSDCWGVWREVRGFHTGSNGWVDIGYSYGVCPHGYTFVGRGAQRSQAAQPGGNTTWTSVYLFVGGDEPLTAAQLDQLAALRADLRDRFLKSGTSIHKRFISTSCPGPVATRMHNSGALWAGGSGAEIDEEHPLIGLEKGDGGELVGALQLRLKRCGGRVAEALGNFGPAKDGVDEDYGDSTAEALRLARESVGSRAEAGWGDKVTKHAYDQLEAAVTRAEIAKALRGLEPSSGSDGPLEIPQRLERLHVADLTADRLRVGE